MLSFITTIDFVVRHEVEMFLTRMKTQSKSKWIWIRKIQKENGPLTFRFNFRESKWLLVVFNCVSIVYEEFLVYRFEFNWSCFDQSWELTGWKRNRYGVNPLSFFFSSIVTSKLIVLPFTLWTIRKVLPKTSDLFRLGGRTRKKKGLVLTLHTLHHYLEIKFLVTRFFYLRTPLSME